MEECTEEFSDSKQYRQNYVEMGNHIGPKAEFISQLQVDLQILVYTHRCYSNKVNILENLKILQK